MRSPALHAAAIAAARSRNAHDRRGEAYAIMQQADDAPPSAWSAGGFERAELVCVPTAAVDALLANIRTACRPAPPPGPCSRCVLALDAPVTRL